MTRQVEIIGHRGARGLFPENSLEGFRDALAMGVRSFELDVGMTADGVVVVSHDPALNPDITRDPRGVFLSGPPPLIRTLTLTELKDYDVGRIRPNSIYRILHRAQKPRDGARIPTLRDVLRLDAGAHFIIEMKTDPRHPDWTVDPAVLADAVLAIVDETGTANRIVIELFDWRGPRHVRRVRPEITLAWLTRPETVRDAALWWDGETPVRHGSIQAAVAAQGGTIWAPSFQRLTRQAVAQAHELGLLVIPWTVNRRKTMRRLVAQGVDGLISDRPDLALVVVAAAVQPDQA